MRVDIINYGTQPEKPASEAPGDLSGGLRADSVDLHPAPNVKRKSAVLPSPLLSPLYLSRSMHMSLSDMHRTLQCPISFKYSAVKIINRHIAYTSLLFHKAVVNNK
jgi:hypothetical protein